MTIVTVKASDTASAMEEIVEKLGPEAYILATKKVGNETLVRATNNPGKRKQQSTVKKSNFSAVMSEKLQFTNNFDTKVGDKKNSDLQNAIGKNQRMNQFDMSSIDEIKLELSNLRKCVDGMVITDMAGLSPNLTSSAKVQLHKLGFSSQLLTKLRDSLAFERSSDGIDKFLENLSRLLSEPNSREEIEKSKYIFLLGNSGSGKTTLAAKLAASFAQHSKTSQVALSQLGAKKDVQTDLLRSFSRLLNVPNVPINKDTAVDKLLEVDQKVFVDTSFDINETLKTIALLKTKVSAGNFLAILVVPCGSNKYYLETLCKNYRHLNPMVIFTKTDENFISPEELSCIADHNLRIGCITGTRSILNSLSFLNDVSLAQYLKESLKEIG